MLISKCQESVALRLILYAQRMLCVLHFRTSQRERVFSSYFLSHSRSEESGHCPSYRYPWGTKELTDSMISKSYRRKGMQSPPWLLERRRQRKMTKMTQIRDSKSSPIKQQEDWEEMGAYISNVNMHVHHLNFEI